MMRISGGSCRGQLITAGSKSVRATSARAREVVFNLLQHRQWDFSMAGTRVLDVCCGSGSLGIEALSRGANHCTFLDRAHGALAVTRTNLDRLGLSDQASLLQGNATCLPRALQASDLVFLDPPYRNSQSNLILASLIRGGWFATSAIIVIESSAREQYPEYPDGYTILDRRRSGEAKLEFLRYNGTGSQGITAARPKLLQRKPLTLQAG